MTVENGDLGGALDSMASANGTESAPVPDGAAPIEQPQSPSTPSTPTEMAVPEPAGAVDMTIAFDAYLRAKAFRGPTVKKYRNFVAKFGDFLDQRGWTWGTMPQDAAATWISETPPNSSARHAARQAIRDYGKVLEANGVPVSQQTVPNSVVNPVPRARKNAKDVPMAASNGNPPPGQPAGAAANPPLPSPPAAMLPPVNGAAPHAPAPFVLQGALQPQLQAQQPQPMRSPPGVVMWRVYRRLNPGEGVGMPGSYVMINDFPADSVVDIEGFVRQQLAPQHGPGPGSTMPVTYRFDAIASNGGRIAQYSREVTIAPPAGFGGFGGGMPGVPYGAPQPFASAYGAGGYGAGGYGQPQPVRSPIPPEVEYVMQRTREDAEKYRAEVDALRKEVKDGSGKMDPGMLMLLLQKIEAMKPPDPQRSMDEAWARARGGGGFGGFGALGSPYPGAAGPLDPFGMPLGNPFGGLPVAAPDPAAATMSELTKDAMNHAFAATKPTSPLESIEAMARVQQLMKGNDRGMEMMLETMREDRRAAQEETRELRREMRDMLATKKSLVEQMGEMVAMKGTMAKLGMIKDDDDDRGEDSFVSVFRDLVNNAEEVGRGAKELIGAFRGPTSADLAAAHAKNLAAAGGGAGQKALPGKSNARPDVAAANISAADAVANAERKIQASTDAAAGRAEAAQRAAQAEPTPEGVEAAMAAILELPGDGSPEAEHAIVMQALGMISALENATTPNARALGTKAREIFLKVDTLAGIRNLIVGIFEQLHADASLINDTALIDKIARPLHKHYPTILEQMGVAVRRPRDWLSVWGAEGATSAPAAANASAAPAASAQTPASAQVIPITRVAEAVPVVAAAETPGVPKVAPVAAQIDPTAPVNGVPSTILAGPEELGGDAGEEAEGDEGEDEDDAGPDDDDEGEPIDDDEDEDDGEDEDVTAP